VFAVERADDELNRYEKRAFAVGKINSSSICHSEVVGRRLSIAQCWVNSTRVSVCLSVYLSVFLSVRVYVCPLVLESLHL